MKKFTFTEITHFNDCNGCPFNEYTNNDLEPVCNRCIFNMPSKIIKEYHHGKEEDYRNKEGVLDTCPFLKKSKITNEY